LEAQSVFFLILLAQILLSAVLALRMLHLRSRGYRMDHLFTVLQSCLGYARHDLA